MKTQVTFQAEQNFGQGSKAWIYFDASPDLPIEDLKVLAINSLKEDWNKENSIPRLIGSAKPCRPTVHVRELEDNQKKKNGITFKVVWR